jgi:hypothetical protein
VYDKDCTYLTVHQVEMLGGYEVGNVTACMVLHPLKLLSIGRSISMTIAILGWIKISTPVTYTIHMNHLYRNMPSDLVKQTWAISFFTKTGNISALM